MKSQIRGLYRSSKNVQDGISLIQTAEGALKAITEMLQRMRELTVCAKNDTNTLDDKLSIQKEIHELVLEIDSISKNTNFNSRNVFDVESESDNKVRQFILNGLKSGWLKGAQNVVDKALGLNIEDPIKLNINIFNGDLGGEVSSVSGNNEELNFNIDLKDFQDDSNLKVSYDRIIAHEFTHIAMISEFGMDKISSIPDWFKEGSADLVIGADERLKQVISNLNGEFDNNKLNELISRGVDLLNGANWIGDDKDYAASYVIMKYLNSKLDAYSNIKDFMNSIKTSSENGLDALKNSITLNTDSTISSFDNFIDDFKLNAKDFVENNITLDWNKDESDVGSILGLDGVGTALDNKSVIHKTSLLKNDQSVEDDQPLKNVTINWGSGPKNNSNMFLQIGANGEQTMKLEFDRISVDSLGLYNLNILNNEIGANSKNPNTPGDPTNPGNPNNPNTPGNPTNPGNPNTPSNPGNPTNPGNPNNPSNPGDPNNPKPDDPNTPTNPEKPNTPTNPDPTKPTSSVSGQIATFSNVGRATVDVNVGRDNLALGKEFKITIVKNSGDYTSASWIRGDLVISLASHSSVNTLQSAVNQALIDGAWRVNDAWMRHRNLIENFDPFVVKVLISGRIIPSDVPNTFHLEATINKGMPREFDSIESTTSNYNISISQKINSNDPIEIIDKALDKVSSFNAKLGAYTNRLNHVINNLNTTSDNLTEANSRIMDCDIAKTWIDFAKNKLLKDTAQSMLLQSDLNNKRVLNLLQ